jgi:hypothetical protein
MNELSPAGQTALVVEEFLAHQREFYDGGDLGAAERLGFTTTPSSRPPSLPRRPRVMSASIPSPGVQHPCRTESPTHTTIQYARISSQRRPTNDRCH